MSDPETVTDISDKSFEELAEGDRNVVQELAGERDQLDGRVSNVDIVRGLFHLDGRSDEIPEEYRDDDDLADRLAPEGWAAEEESADASSDDTATDSESDTAADDGGDTEAEADEGFQTASNYEPSDESRFIIDADRLDEWLDHIGAMVEEAKVHLEPDDLRVRAVDAANVGMVEAPLYSRAFESFTVTEPGVIGVNTVRLADIVGGADAGDLVSLDYDPQVRNLIIRHGGHEFTMALIDPASIRKEPDLPELNLPVVVELEGRALNTAIGYADSVSDHMAFKYRPSAGADEAAFAIAAEGDTDSYEYEATPGDDEISFLEYADEAKESLFSLDYLKDIKAAIPADATVRIEFGQEFPVHISLDIEDDDRDVGEATYMLAPRIQSD